MDLEGVVRSHPIKVIHVAQCGSVSIIVFQFQFPAF